MILTVSLESAKAQEITYQRDIAPIVRKNCSPCHQAGKSAPFELLTYSDVASRGSFIKHVTTTGYMPPWYADTTFSSFANERGLTQQEVKTIAAWVDGGMVKGKKKSRKAREAAIATNPDFPDLIVGMNQPFEIPGDQTEQYRFFIVPTDLNETKYIRKIQFKPGNLRLVHHSRIMADTTNLLRPIDGISEFDPKLIPYRSIPLEDEFLFGWVPGNTGVSFPPGCGKRLSKKTDLILNIHYAPTSLPEPDSSNVEIYYHEGPVEREVKTLALDERRISNPPFAIPPDTTLTFYMRSEILASDISVISVLPHMHLLGKEFKSYAITPQGDLIPLIHIPDWNFDWQETYQYNPMLRIPKGSVIYAQATYDNTRSNPRNPFDPPQLIRTGWNTTDEMFNLIIFYVDYKEDDDTWNY